MHNHSFSEKLTLKSLAAEFNMNPIIAAHFLQNILAETFSSLILQNFGSRKPQNLLHNSNYSLEEDCPPWLVLKITFISAKYLKNTANILQKNIILFHIKNSQ